MQIKSWSDGYYTDLEVYDGYVHEISPLLIELNLTIAGYSLESMKSDKIGNIKYFKYLELGFGKGSSLNVHASSSVGEFIGNDFNPRHALLARDFAIHSEANIDIYDDSFAELESRLQNTLGDTPKECDKFDYIVAHGVFSWINAKNREIILRIVKKYLKLGGIVYNSYNCLPGWALKMPARHIFALYNKYAKDNPISRIQNCITFFETLLKYDPMFAKLNPHSTDFIDQIKNLPNSQQSYIAHEYLNADWELFYFSDMVDLMSSAKCEYLCSGKVIEHFEEFSITSDGVEFLGHINDRIFREQLKDYFTNKQFRVDLYAKACKKISLLEAKQKLLNTKFMLTRIVSEFDYKADTARGSIDLLKDRYEKLFEILSNDKFAPKSLNEIMLQSKLNFSQTMTSIMLLIHKGMASPVQDINDKILSQVKGYNDYLFTKQSKSLSSLYVASGLTSSAIVLSESEQIFAKAYNDLVRGNREYVDSLDSKEIIEIYDYLANKKNFSSDNLQDYFTQYVFRTFKPQDRKHVKNGEILQGDLENIKEIKRLAEQFMTNKLDLLKALRILE